MGFNFDNLEITKTNKQKKKERKKGKKTPN